MQIVNPLYDKAFKYLMQNNRMAKKVLSVDIRRFRNYLGANYMNITKQEDKNESLEEAIYPIITIYILGYKLEDIPYMAVTVNRQVVDAATNKTLNINSFFINHLTHRSHILQVKRLPDKRKTKLEKFMVLFNQAWCTEKRYIIDLQDIPAEFKDIAQHLQKPVMDTEFRRQLEAEEEIDSIFERQESKFLKKIEEAKKAKKEAEAREAEERHLRKKIVEKSVQKLYEKGLSVSEISATLEIPETIVNKILEKQKK